MSYRPVLGQDQTVVQSSITVNPADYRHQAMNSLVLGVILEVVPIDSDQNRSSMQTVDRKGHTHECTVLVVNDGTPAYMTLENVLITPDSPSGLDDFTERLPRGSSQLVSGAEYNTELHGIDPYDLDGDWCVVGFLGGQIQAPFIVRWWPHSRNTFDAASSGKGLEGDLLVQDRRYFRRTNGVETIITSKGDVVISTTRANSVLTPSEEPAFGRIARTLNEDIGGSIRLNIKPTQTFEMSFNPQDEGIGVANIADPELPQLNPPVDDPESAEEQPETYIYIDRDQADFIVTTSVTVITQDTITLVAENLVELGADQIHLGIDAEEGIPRDDHIQQQLDEIKAALDSHTHEYNECTGGDVGVVAPAQNSPSENHGYSVGDTATDLVKGI
jgi:hypothetical protein